MNTFCSTLQPPVPIIFIFFYIFLLAHYISVVKHVKDKTWHQSERFEIVNLHFVKSEIIFTQLRLWIASARHNFKYNWIVWRLKGYSIEPSDYKSEIFFTMRLLLHKSSHGTWSGSVFSRLSSPISQVRDWPRSRSRPIRSLRTRSISHFTPELISRATYLSVTGFAGRRSHA